MRNSNSFVFSPHTAIASLLSQIYFPRFKHTAIHGSSDYFPRCKQTAIQAAHQRLEFQFHTNERVLKLSIHPLHPLCQIHAFVGETGLLISSRRCDRSFSSTKSS